MWWWWWVWIAFIFFVFFVPLSYGWGRRGWGPPCPTYYRRRVYAQRSTIVPESGQVVVEDPAAPAPVDPYSASGWTWLADLFWLAVLAAIAWAVYLAVT